MVTRGPAGLWLTASLLFAAACSFHRNGLSSAGEETDDGGGLVGTPGSGGGPGPVPTGGAGGQATGGAGGTLVPDAGLVVLPPDAAVSPQISPDAPVIPPPA